MKPNLMMRPVKRPKNGAQRLRLFLVTVFAASSVFSKDCEQGRGGVGLTCFESVLSEPANEESFTGRGLDRDTKTKNSKWRLVWSDEFNRDGLPDTTVWNYEEGFVRNGEAQWYQKANAYQKDGCLIIEGRKEHRPNPTYDPASKQWGRQREFINYTSSSLNTAGKREFCYGRLEVRAKIPTAPGAWPAIWTLGRDMEWPSCGEIDVMEFYRPGGHPHILANAAWGSDRRWDAVWNSVKTPLEHFTGKDSNWSEQFHVWRMDWDNQHIRLYLDDELLNDIPMTSVRNGILGNGENPFTKPQYILLNLALGGDNGGEIEGEALPMKYVIDYVRIYEKK